MSTDHIKYTDPRNEIADLKTLLAMANERNDAARARIAELEAQLADECKLSPVGTSQFVRIERAKFDEILAAKKYAGRVLNEEKSAHLATQRALVEIKRDAWLWASAFCEEEGGEECAEETHALLRKHAEVIKNAVCSVAQADGKEAV